MVRRGGGCNIEQAAWRRMGVPSLPWRGWLPRTWAWVNRGQSAAHHPLLPCARRVLLAFLLQYIAPGCRLWRGLCAAPHGWPKLKNAARRTPRCRWRACPSARCCGAGFHTTPLRSFRTVSSPLVSPSCCRWSPGGPHASGPAPPSASDAAPSAQARQSACWDPHNATVSQQRTGDAATRPHAWSLSLCQGPSARPQACRRCSWRKA